MADIITETNAPLEQPQVDAKAELAQAMQIALNNGRIPQEQQIIENTESNPAPESTDSNIVIEPPANAPAPISFDSLKEKFAYEKPEDAIKEIEEFRKFKENPVAEIEFENEASKKLFEAIKGGKQKEAYAILAEQEQLDNFTSAEVTKDNAADIIKLGMKYKYKDLTPSEIDYKYKKQFSHPKEPIQTEGDDPDEFAARHNEWKNQVSDIEMEKIMEAKLIKPELESRKAKLVLPDIEAEIDEDYIQWQKSKEVNPAIEAERIAELKSFTPKTIETKINFNDEANKVAFEYQYEPTPEDFKETMEMMNDISKFYQKFILPDGKPDRKEFAKALHFATNHDKIIVSAINQGKNARIKSELPNNNNGGIIRQLPQGQQMSELDKNMAASGIRR